MLLSPPCDVAVRKVDNDRPAINAESIVLAHLLQIDYETLIQHHIIDEKNGLKDHKNRLEKIIKGREEKYIFLPEYRDIGPYIADLQNLHAWPLDDYLQAQRLATVSGAFLKDIQSRFTAYYGRQGQPDLDKDSLLNKYKSRLSPPE